MPDHSGEHAKQQMRKLGQAVQNAARQVDRAYPNTNRGDRIVSDFRQRTNRLGQNGRQHGKRPLEKPGSFSPSGASSEIPFGLILILLAVIVPLLLFLTCTALM
jgi:hypothetical protein